MQRFAQEVSIVTFNIYCIRVSIHSTILFRWFELRKEAEEFYNITVNTNPCPKIGLMHYKHMALQDAVLPTQNANSKYDTVQFLVPDDSPDRFDPFPEARYIN